MTTVCFVLKSFSFYPTGGVKMIFDYANHLVKQGYRIQILYLNDEALKKYHIPEKLREKVVTVLNHFSPNWYKLSPQIESLSLYDRTLDQKVHETDYFVATSVPTVASVIEKFPDAKKLYFIQGFENWTVSDEYCYETYASGMKNIVIAKWLKKIVDQYSQEPSTLIPNPIDTDIYCCMTPIKNRKEHTVGVLYHEMPHKGLKYSLQALSILKKKYSDLEVYMFGVPDRPRNFPTWIHYTKKATQQQTVDLYNNCQVFLCATIEEGFGLTGLEAMACGCALVSTNYQGVREYAKDEYNALLSPVKNVDYLVKNVSRVFEDINLRTNLSENGIKSAKAFSWDNALRKFEKLIA